MELLPASGRKQSGFDALAKDIHEVCNRQSGGHQMAQRLISSSTSNLDFSFFFKKKKSLSSWDFLLVWLLLSLQMWFLESQQILLCICIKYWTRRDETLPICCLSLWSKGTFSGSHWTETKLRVSFPNSLELLGFTCESRAGRRSHKERRRAAVCLRAGGPSTPVLRRQLHYVEDEPGDG